MDSSRSSSPPLAEPDWKPPAAQWWKVPVKWYGGEDGGQDVCIRLVRCSLEDQMVGRRPLLALVAAHSVLLVTYCQYFRDKAQRFELTPSPTCTLHEVTLYLDGDDDDVLPYFDCFNTLYNPPPEGQQLYNPQARIPYGGVGFKPDAAIMQDIKNILKLLGAASHIGYDALSISICQHLVEMDSFGTVLKEATSGLRKEGVPYLIRAYCHSNPWNAHPHKSAVSEVLRKARDQEWTPTPTFEQGVVAIVEKELKRLLVEARNEYGEESALTAEGNNEALPLPSPQKMEKIRDMLKKAFDMLEVMLRAQVQSEGVKWLLQNSWIPKLLSHESILSGDDRSMFNEAITSTMVTVHEEVEGGRVLVDSSDLYVLLKDWTFFMESHGNRETGGRGPWTRYEKAKKAIIGCLPHDMQTQLIVMEADRGCFATFGYAAEVWKLLKEKMEPREGR